MRRSVASVTLAASMTVTACTSGGGSTSDNTVTDTAVQPIDTTVAAAPSRFVYPDPPATPVATEPNPEADAAIARLVEGVENGFFDAGGVTELNGVGDARYAWFVADLLRFFGGDDAEVLVDSFETLTGVAIDDDPDAARSPWMSVTNHLIAWDTPDYPRYQADKGGVFTLLEEGWEPFFDDADAEIDWRHLSWGGVFIDDRPLGANNNCPGGCIPALDDPATTDAAGGSWYPGERIVFGIELDGDALAIPLNIAEIHEMFNLTLGGRRLGIPYCTLCGSAQAYFTDTIDTLDEPGVLRTSGLLVRSNKVMYELTTQSVFDTFTGDAVSGPLQEADVMLEETTVVRTTWDDWRAEHPDTRIIAEDGGIGRSYQLDPLGGRDDDGPIFPIGDADARLDLQELVVGVITADGTPLAFSSSAAKAALDEGDDVVLAGVALRSSGGGLVAVDADSGEPIAAHEAFWFAWSQFHPDTLLWER
ncbi:DUF3179 domain-containing (seleno)protein [Ilumatobacter coccineus]|uniref:DUF3179 domain-containing protein n=1 Tax=Ilumatobacter coccineus (strain NBRC 103263 / KCTC 29153 / YM16-304) TaxID=1313172 RepID=A0A6C7E5X4_ILUCY|nr:DUF3179 domain-containing (seleno)protein [Ilumatobacter coccineus]BAN01522.1 hypothetical protein YM304_12080 [Ilumatobacter coccineus YM16-304]